MARFNLANGSYVDNNKSIVDVVMVTGATVNNTITVGDVGGIGASVEVTPTVNTTASYANGNIMGGILSFPAILNPTNNSAIVQSMTLKFKNTIQTGQYDVALFTGSPTGTYTDKANAAIANTDSALLLGVYALSSPISILGTHTVYNLDGIGKQLTSNAGANLFAVVIAVNGTTVNCTSTSDMSLRISTIL